MSAAVAFSRLLAAFFGHFREGMSPDVFAEPSMANSVGHRGLNANSSQRGVHIDIATSQTVSETTTTTTKDTSADSSEFSQREAAA